MTESSERLDAVRKSLINKEERRLKVGRTFERKEEERVGEREGFTRVEIMK